MFEKARILKMKLQEEEQARKEAEQRRRKEQEAAREQKLAQQVRIKIMGLTVDLELTTIRM